MPLFSTWVYLCHEGPTYLNEKLEQLTFQLMHDDHNGTCRTNDGGWHYAHDLFVLDTPVVIALRDHLEQHVQAFLIQLRGGANAAKKDRFRLQGWINVNRTGNRNVLHCHPGCFLSGTYYVKIPSDMQGGEIVFRDPRGPAVAMYETPGIELPWVGSGSGIPFAPATGQVLLFPGWLEHRVEPFRGDSDRISIAFNATNP